MSVEKFIVLPTISVREAVQKIDELGKRIVFIADENRKLKGVFSDGDMRRYILKNGNLDKPVSLAMNKKPVRLYTHSEIDMGNVSEQMMAYPVVDENDTIVDIIFWNDTQIKKTTSNVLSQVPVVIIAGGKGTRLHPYTKILPKPLIPIGETTITERIIHSFKKFGCNSYTMILNHKSSMIKAYFGEVDKSYELNFVDEKEFLGTGGGLSLLKNKINSTFFVSNCDIIVDADYYSLYKFHKENKNIITFVCAMKNITIPYGVVDMDKQGNIKEIVEKPEYSFLTNTGLYILEPQVLNELKENTFIHLTDIAKNYIHEGHKVGVYPISEKSWLDMGQIEEMENMINILGME